MDLIDRIFLQNKAWATEKAHDQPEYFEKLSAGQKPDFFWIGCADSRVPANDITNTVAGQVFAHRNIANLVVDTDVSLLASLQYAVETLKVRHIIVCGHYGCGGVKAALSNTPMDNVNTWVKNIKEVYQDNKSLIDSASDEEAKTDALVEANVIAQVNNLKKTDILKKAWQNGNLPYLHGWVYSLKSGLLKNLVSIDASNNVSAVNS
jgi:carbonic anhydrase